MWIDVVFLIMLAIGIVKGAMQGIVMALFAFAGWIIGLLAALKLSAVAAAYLQEHTRINTRWLPFIAFLLVFFTAVLLVRWAGKAVESIVGLAMLGWVNRMGGALLYVGMFTLAGSILLYYADKMHIISSATLSASHAYSLTAGIAPGLVEGVSHLIPALKNTFRDLENFFEKMSSSS